MPPNVGFDGVIADQLRQIALGDDKVQQLRPVVLLDVLVLGLDLAHFALEVHDLLQRITLGLIRFRGWGVTTLLGRGGFQQRVGVGGRDAVGCNH